MPLVILFIILPLIELSVFAQVNDSIGLFNTLLLCLLTAIIGGGLLKKQGLQTMEAARQTLSRGDIPTTEIFDGFCLVVSGAFLMTPGFVTDTIGFALLIPQVRTLIRQQVRNHMDVNVHTSSTYRNPNQRPDDIDGDYSRVDDREKLR